MLKPMKYHRQKGSAEIIVIVLVFIAIIAGVGFVAWNSINNKEAAAESTQVVPSEKKDGFKVGQIDEKFPAKMTWKYPADWTQKVGGELEQADATDTFWQEITLTSPSKDYEVRYVVSSNGQYGATCDPEQSGVIHSIAREPVSSLPEAVVAEVVSKNADNTYGFYASLYGATVIEDVKAGLSLCALGSFSSILLSSQQDTSLMMANVRHTKYIPQDAEPVPIKDFKIVEEAVNSKEYKQAVEILRSTALVK